MTSVVIPSTTLSTMRYMQSADLVTVVTVQKPACRKTFGIMFTKLLCNTLLFIVAKKFTTTYIVGVKLQISVPLVLAVVQTLIETTLSRGTSPLGPLMTVGKTQTTVVAVTESGSVTGRPRTQMPFIRSATLCKRLLFRL